MTLRTVLTSLLVSAAILSGCGAPEPAGNEGSANAEDSAAPVAAPPAPPAPPPPVRTDDIPPAFRGVYDRSAEACGRPSEYRLTVSARELRFHESIGAVRSVTAEGPDAVRIEADYQGEGESWRAVQRLSLSDGGRRLVLAGPGEPVVRLRCAPAPAAAGWEAAASGEGAGLALVGPGASRRLVLFCPSGSRELVVNVPAFRPVASEERMSFGAGAVAVVLVADARGDAKRGGVTGRGPVPAELAAILASGEGIAVNYGSQDSGPHPAPPAELARSFVAGCGD